MNKATALLLQAFVVLIALGAMFLLLWEPHLEGRNAQATAYEIYFNDPFLAYAYIASIPFFVGCFQAFKVLGYAGRGQAVSPGAVGALRTLKYCALAIVGFVVGGEVYILSTQSDDAAGGVVIGAVIALGSIIVAGAAAAMGRALQKRMV